MCSTKVFWQCF